MQKRKVVIVVVSLLLIVSSVFAIIFLPGVLKNHKIEKELEKKYSTEICDHAENYVPDKRVAHKLIRAQGVLMREDCEENSVREIERYLEKTYELDAVNLRNMDQEMAEYIKAACDYIYKKYPVLKGYLTNITVTDSVSESSAAIAIYDDSIFIMNPDNLYPIVIRRSILLRAKEFENIRRMKNLVKMNVDGNFWTEGTDIAAVIVHEFGHVLSDCIISYKYGLDNEIYIGEKEKEAYSKCCSEDLSYNQFFEKDICEKAYENYKSQVDADATYDEFCGEISDYAIGAQADGGYSYSETIAEAVSNEYVLGENSCMAAKLIVEELEKAMREYCDK